MRATPNDRVERYRVATPESLAVRNQNCGLFRVPKEVLQQLLGRHDRGDMRIIAYDGLAFDRWEHVSVSIEHKRRCPTWEEMCFAKSLFWDEHECVIQFHPPKAVYVNDHPYVLHLFRLIDFAQPMPAPETIGHVRR